MAYKNALAGLDLGGGKAVIIGDPGRDKSEALLRAYGRFVASLGGRYITACDVGTYVADMDIISRECRWVTGRSPAEGGAGDSSVLTSFGVFQGMRACAERLWQVPSLRGRRVGIAGVGKVGSKLAELLLEDGAEVVVTDVSAAAVERLQSAHLEVTAVPDAMAFADARIDVYAPCALGGALGDEMVDALAAGGSCRAVCGGANNQLAHPGVEKMLEDRGILYAPDYVVNSGGVIQVADELHGFSFDRARGRAEQILQTTRRIFALAADEGVPPAVQPIGWPSGGWPRSRAYGGFTFPADPSRREGQTGRDGTWPNPVALSPRTDVTRSCEGVRLTGRPSFVRGGRPNGARPGQG